MRRYNIFLFTFLLFFLFQPIRLFSTTPPSDIDILEARASLGNVVDQYLYGRALILHHYSKEDIIKGISFLEKAAQKNYAPAILFLAELYEKGIGGVERDYVKAYYWYNIGAKLGLKTAKLKLAPFNDIESKKNEFLLFGIPIKKARRFNIRYVLQKNGATPIKLDDNSYCDIFMSNGFLPGTDRMQICYGLDGKFILMEYRYPPRREKYGIILAKNMDMLTKKYGNPKIVSKVNVIDYYLWEKDGINIYLWMEPKTNTCFLRYVVKDRYIKLKRYLDSQNKTKEIPKIEFY